MIIIINNPNISDRYINQTKEQILNLADKPGKKSNLILPNYMPMFKTSFQMFKEKKLLGMGPKSYRYLCDDKRFVNYFPEIQFTDNTVIKIQKSWKKPGYIFVEKFYVTEDDVIKKGDKIFSYKYANEKKIYLYYSEKEGEIKKFHKKDKNRYQVNDVVFDIIPKNSSNNSYFYRNGCNTHPHNFYIQILAEIGSIGFIFIFGLFLYLFYLLTKNLIFKYSNRKNLFSDSEICILIGFFVTLWPLTTNGNFFNNWINLISFYPLGFFLFIFNKKIKN